MTLKSAFRNKAFCVLVQFSILRTSGTKKVAVKLWLTTSVLLVSQRAHTQKNSACRNRPKLLCPSFQILVFGFFFLAIMLFPWQLGLNPFWTVPSMEQALRIGSIEFDRHISSVPTANYRIKFLITDSCISALELKSPISDMFQQNIYTAATSFIHANTWGRCALQLSLCSPSVATWIAVAAHRSGSH